MRLTVDMGNTAVKIVVFDEDRIVYRHRTEAWNDTLAAELVAGYRPQSAIVSSTRSLGDEVVASIDRAIREAGYEAPVVRLTGLTPTPLRNLYATPETLGPDRLAAAVGGAALFPEQNLLIVDFGTAITYDLVSSRGEYLGGNIAPGMDMRYQSLHRSAAFLPLEEGDTEGRRGEKIGKKTADAIKLGVIDGICYETEGYIQNWESCYKKLTTIFTGGDAKCFEKKIKNTIFAELDLVSIGLNKILEYNAF